MPLEIVYRPIVLPPEAAAPGEPRAPDGAVAAPPPRRPRRRWWLALAACAPLVALGLVWSGSQDAGAAAPLHLPGAVPGGHAAGANPALAALPAPAPLAAGSGLDHWRALQCLTTAIYYEAAREPDDGQRAVAQVVLNRLRHPAFPKTVCGVVYQGSERPGCQFSFACDGSLAHAPARAWWDRARRVAEAALAGETFAPVGLATHYHSDAVHPGWADAMILTDRIGAHRFYRWAGAAGAAQAFEARYRGGEPVAAPHPYTWVSTGADLADPLVLARAFEAGKLAALRAAPAPAPAPGTTAVSASPANAVVAAVPKPVAATPEPGPLAGSGAVRSDVRAQYDSAARWIRQPGE